MGCSKIRQGVSTFLRLHEELVGKDVSKMGKKIANITNAFSGAYNAIFNKKAKDKQMASTTASPATKYLKG